MKYRELTIPEVTSFINDQLWRVKNILNPDPESVLGKVFNTEWLDGFTGISFPSPSPRWTSNTSFLVFTLLMGVMSSLFPLPLR